MRWLSRFVDDDYSDLDAQTREKARSESELLFIPYNTGKELNINKATLRGTVIGRTAGYDGVDLARALMEGAAFETKLALEEFSKYGVKVRRVVMIGEASKSKVWRKIVSEVLEVETYVCEQTEVCALGAAMTAAVG